MWRFPVEFGGTRPKLAKSPDGDPRNIIKLDAPKFDLGLALAGEDEEEL